MSAARIFCEEHATHNAACLTCCSVAEAARAGYAQLVPLHSNGPGRVVVVGAVTETR
jgi:hypothetical protein